MFNFLYFLYFSSSFHNKQHTHTHTHTHTHSHTSGKRCTSAGVVVDATTHAHHVSAVTDTHTFLHICRHVGSRGDNRHTSHQCLTQPTPTPTPTSGKQCTSAGMVVVDATTHAHHVSAITDTHTFLHICRHVGSRGDNRHAHHISALLNLRTPTHTHTHTHIHVPLASDAHLQAWWWWRRRRDRTGPSLMEESLM